MHEENKHTEETKDGDNNGELNVGKNDKYLISKLKTYNITLDKLDSYSAKLQSDNGMEQNRNFANLAYL